MGSSCRALVKPSTSSLEGYVTKETAPNIYNLLQHIMKEMKTTLPYSRKFFIIAAVLFLVGIGLILFSYASFITSNVSKSIFQEVGNSLITSAIVSSFLEIYLLDKSIKGHTIVDVLDFFRKTGKPREIYNNAQMYEEGTRIIKESEVEVIIFQKTPNILVGSRPVDEERCFEQACKDKIKEVQETKKKFYILFSPLEIRNYIKEHPAERDAIKSRYDDYMAVQSSTRERFKLRGIDGTISGPLVISDKGYMVWIGKGNPSERILVLSSDIPTEGVPDKLEILVANAPVDPDIIFT